MDKACNEKSVPRWAFITAMGAMMTVSMGFASWQITSLNEIKRTIDHRLNQIQRTTESRTAEAKRLAEERTRDVKERYLIDIERFYKAAEENRSLLMKLSQEQSDVRVDLSEIRTFQQMLLKKVRIQNGNGQ